MPSLLHRHMKKTLAAIIRSNKLTIRWEKDKIDVNREMILERWTSVIFVPPKAKPRGRSEEGGDCPVTPKAKSRGRNEEENRNRLPARRS